MKRRTAGFIEGLAVGLAGVIAGTAISWFCLPGFRKNVAMAALSADTGATEDNGSGTEGSTAQTAGGTVGNADLMEKLQLMQAYLDQVYLFDEADAQTSRDAIYKAYMDSQGDPYTVYYTADEYSSLTESTNGEYCGVGVEIQQDPDTLTLTILRVFSGSPAQSAGLKAGDILQSADGTDLSGMDIQSAVSLIRGEEGTTVHLTWYRPSAEETMEADVERRQVNIDTVSAEMLDSGIGYIQVTEFDAVTTSQFEAAVDSCQNQGAEGLIIDLRDNPGGLLTTVINMCDYILPKGVIVTTKDKYGEGDSYDSTDDHTVDLPIAVLVNGSSASASEIFAGAMKDRGAGTIVGTTTYGKGIVQSLFPLDDGSALKITVSNYYTPSGVSIQGTGITPDVEVELSEDADLSDASHAGDNQLRAAEKAIQDAVQSGSSGTESGETVPETETQSQNPDTPDLTDAGDGQILAENPDTARRCA